MKSVTTSSASDVVVMNTADSDRDMATAFGSGSQRRIRILTRQESIMPNVQSRGDLRTDSSENTSFASGGNKKCSVSKKSEREVLHADVNGQGMHPLESLSPEGTLSALFDLAINSSNSSEASPSPSDPVITATGKNNSRSDICSGSTVRLRNSNSEIWIENQIKERSDKTVNIPAGVDIPAINLTSQEKNPVLKGPIDVGSVEKSPPTRAEIPEDLMARSRPECARTQSSAPDFSPGSGARPKTVPATSRKKQRQSKKNAKNRAGSNFVKDTAITSSTHSAAIAFVQDETGKEKVATRQSIKKQLVQSASLSQQLLQADRNELMTFNDEIKKFYGQMMSLEWEQMDMITRNLQGFIPRLEALIREYEILAERYPASSIDKSKSGKTENSNIGGVIFTYSHRSGVTEGFCQMARYVMDNVGAFLINNRQREECYGALLEIMLKMACIWFRFATEFRVNDWQAINDRGEGVFVADIPGSGSSADSIPLKSQREEPKCTEIMINSAFYLALSWLVTNEIFYSKHAKDAHQSKSEYLAVCPQLLMQLLHQYRKHRPFRNYTPYPPPKGNLLEDHIDYANQLVFFVRVQDWDSVLATLQRLVSLTHLEGVEPDIKSVLAVPVQQEKESRVASGYQQDMKSIVLKEYLIETWRGVCEEKYLYEIHEYLIMALEAGHCSFNHFGQEVTGSTAQQRLSLIHI